jgi:SAM-dependent methyltransferase
MRPVPNGDAGISDNPRPVRPGKEGLDFGEYYYAHDCGIPYERNHHWNQFFATLADQIIVALDPKSVLDAGCAIGMLVESLRNRHVDAYGIDVSEWAIANMPEAVRRYCRNASLVEPIEGHYDLVTCIEVIEHIPSPDDAKAVEQLCKITDRILLSSSPHDYAEPTHVTVRPPEDWATMFARQGFVRDVDFDATFLTPWAVLYRRNHDPLPEVVRHFERRLARSQEEVSQLRTRALQMQDQLERDYAAVSIAQLRQELLAVREALVTTTAEAGKARGRIRELEDELTRHEAATSELADVKRSRAWSTFVLYARLRHKFAPLRKLTGK